MTEQELKEKLEEVNSLLRELRQLWSLEQEEMPDNECADAPTFGQWLFSKQQQLGIKKPVGFDRLGVEMYHGWLYREYGRRR